MGKIFFIRHAQASFLKEDYDQLSDLGLEQSGMLGAYLAEKKFRFDKVYLGTLKRHRQTAEAVELAFRKNNLHWPAYTFLDAFDEHQGPEVVRHVVTQNYQSKDAFAAYKQPQNVKDNIRNYFKVFQKITRQWMNKELEELAAAYEPWQDFTIRVHNGIETVRKASEGGEHIAVFTSGGPVAAAMAYALDLSPEKMLELSWLVQNTAITEFVFSKNRFNLKSFNSVAHLPAEKFITSV